MPDAERPYRAWGYPVVPGLFVLAAIIGVTSAYVAAPLTSLFGTAILAVGAVAYMIFWRSTS
jgi:APA family basic amino acid/polyamine antiporter